MIHVCNIPMVTICFFLIFFYSLKNDSVGKNFIFNNCKTDFHIFTKEFTIKNNVTHEDSANNIR